VTTNRVQITETTRLEKTSGRISSTLLCMRICCSRIWRGYILHTPLARSLHKALAKSSASLHYWIRFQSRRSTIRGRVDQPVMLPDWSNTGINGFWGWVGGMLPRCRGVQRAMERTMTSLEVIGLLTPGVTLPTTVFISRLEGAPYRLLLSLRLSCYDTYVFYIFIAGASQ
jgi:hypothetical protein